MRFKLVACMYSSRFRICALNQIEHFVVDCGQGPQVPVIVGVGLVGRVSTIVLGENLATRNSSRVSFRSTVQAACAICVPATHESIDSYAELAAQVIGSVGKHSNA